MNDTDLTATIFGRTVPIPREQAQKAAGTIALLSCAEGLSPEERDLVTKAGDAISRLLWSDGGDAG